MSPQPVPFAGKVVFQVTVCQVAVARVDLFFKWHSFPQLVFFSMGDPFFKWQFSPQLVTFEKNVDSSFKWEMSGTIWNGVFVFRVTVFSSADTVCDGEIVFLPRVVSSVGRYPLTGNSFFEWQLSSTDTVCNTGIVFYRELSPKLVPFATGYSFFK